MPDREPYLEPRHEQARATLRAFALAELEPLDARAEHDVAGAARACVRAMGGQGALRLAVPRAHGGDAEQVEARALVAAREGIAYASGLADAMLALQGLGALPLAYAGSEAQRAAWLPRVASGRAIAGFAVTEPGAGSDAAAMRTRARRTRDGWELEGEKTLISNAGIADYYVLLAKTDPDAGARGITAFLVPGDARGLKAEPLRPLAPHPLGSLALERVPLPADAVVGREGEGFKLAMRTLDLMRPTVAAAACGLASRALDAAVERARARQQFGRPIGEHQGLRWRLAEASTELEAARLLAYRAAWRKDQGQERVTLEAAQAKLFATEAAQRVVDLCVQVHGGSGVLAGSLPERLYREVRALRIYEGTSEVLRDVVGRAVLDPPKDGAAGGV